MEIGTRVIALTDKLATDGLGKVFIPKGTGGTVCEIYDDCALVEIWGRAFTERSLGCLRFLPDRDQRNRLITHVANRFRQSGPAFLILSRII